MCIERAVIGVVDFLTEQATVDVCGDLYVFVRDVISNREGDGPSSGRRVQKFNFVAQTALGQD